MVYPVILNNGDNIGYVQAVPLNDMDWEIGYHIAEKYTGKGYATDAVKAFLPIIMEWLSQEKIYGICLAENIASCRVMEKKPLQAQKIKKLPKVNIRTIPYRRLEELPLDFRRRSCIIMIVTVETETIQGHTRRITCVFMKIKMAKRTCSRKNRFLP